MFSDITAVRGENFFYIKVCIVIKLPEKIFNHYLEYFKELFIWFQGLNRPIEGIDFAHFYQRQKIISTI